MNNTTMVAHTLALLFSINSVQTIQAMKKTDEPDSIINTTRTKLDKIGGFNADIAKQAGIILLDAIQASKKETTDNLSKHTNAISALEAVVASLSARLHTCETSTEELQKKQTAIETACTTNNQTLITAEEKNNKYLAAMKQHQQTMFVGVGMVATGKVLEETCRNIENKNIRIGTACVSGALQSSGEGLLVAQAMHRVQGSLSGDSTTPIVATTYAVADLLQKAYNAHFASPPDKEDQRQLRRDVFATFDENSNNIEAAKRVVRNYYDAQRPWTRRTLSTITALIVNTIYSTTTKTSTVKLD